MGTAHDTREQLADSAGSTVDHLRDAPGSVAQRTEGSPLAAGGVAFAIGFLAAAVWRPTAPERHAVEKVAEAAPDLVDDVAQAGRDLAGSVKEQAVGATEELKSSVADAATAIKETATGADAEADSDR